MLAEFPSRDLDVPATKEFVRSEISDLRSEMHNEITGLRGELQGDMASLEGRILGRLNVMMIWMTGVLITSVGVVTSIVTAVS